MSASAFCYQLSIPFSVDLLGKELVYREPGGYASTTVYLENLTFTSTAGSTDITYYFCSEIPPSLFVFGTFSDFTEHGLALAGGITSCAAHSDCAPPTGGGAGSGSSTTSYCYRIDINTGEVNSSAVNFQYTPHGAQTSTTISADNWGIRSVENGILSLYVCSGSQPLILINGAPVSDPSQFGITVYTQYVTCTTDSSCSPALPPVNCTLSDWGWGETQQSWVAGEWSPCTFINGSYQRYQTRYVITPASNGGTCIGDTIQYETCTPPQSGSTATLTVPTADSITSTSANVSTTISNTGGSPVVSVLFKLFQNGNLVDNRQTFDSAGTWSLGISVQFNNLTPNTQYTVIAIAANSTGSSTTQQGQFTTGTQGGFSILNLTQITQIGATITSTFTNSGGEIYERYGIIYKIGNSNNLQVGQPGVVKVDSGPFNSELSPTALITILQGLVPNIQYYVKAYVQAPGSAGAYVYSAAATFTTAATGANTNFASLTIESIALDGSAGTPADYNFITIPSNNLNRAYVSVISPTPEDPTPGAYKISAQLQQVNLTSCQWRISTKSGPGQSEWTETTIAAGESETIVPGWSYFEYGTGPNSIKFRPGISGYYKIEFFGLYLNNSPFSVAKEIVIGTPTEDLNLSYQELRQGISANLQVSALPGPQTWIPVFGEDNLYGVAVTQSGSTVTPTIITNNLTTSFSALWGINPANQKITPTLTVTYTSPFKNSTLSNTFNKNFSVTVLAPYPTISFLNPSLFSTSVTTGSNVTIGVATNHANSYIITSTLGNGIANTPITYTGVSTGTYTITATATNDSGATQQTTTINSTLLVQPSAPILLQVPQQVVGRNIFSDINLLPYVNLNGSTFGQLEIVTPSSNGTLIITNYTIRYIPNQDYTGTDLFSIKVKSLSNTYSNTVNIGVQVQSPLFTAGPANQPVIFNSTEVGAPRTITVPITNVGNTGFKINEITIDQDSTDFIFVIGSGQNETTTASIQNITINPNTTHSVKIRVIPTALGVRTANLKINHT